MSVDSSSPSPLSPTAVASSPRRVALVTGASAGIGAAIARALSRRGFDLALTARRGETLEALADDIAASGRPRPAIIALDLAAPGAAETLLAALPADRFVLAALVNNAGFALRGDAAELSRAEQVGMIDLNARALTDLTLACLPRLKAAGGRILNVASVVAALPGPGMAVYYASKAYVLSFGEALAQELKGSGVTVTTLCPGPVATAFWDRAGGEIDGMRRLAMTPEAVAEAGVAAMMAGRRRVTPGLANRALMLIAPLLPRGLLLPIVARMQPPRRR